MKPIKYNNENDNKYMTEEQKREMNIYSKNTDSNINETDINEKSNIEYFTE